MSLKKNGARLWFESQQEEDDYDDLMVSNMEIKTDDFDDENFTIVSVRQRKEKLPGTHSETFYNGLARLEAMMIGKSHIRIAEHGYKDSVSLLVNKNYYVFQHHFAWFAGYLLLRELPLRNFYARSSIMFLYFMRYAASWGTPYLASVLNNTAPNLIVHVDHNKEREIFNWFKDTDTSNKASIDGQGK